MFFRYWRRQLQPWFLCHKCVLTFQTLYVNCLSNYASLDGIASLSPLACYMPIACFMAYMLTLQLLFYLSHIFVSQTFGEISPHVTIVFLNLTSNFILFLVYFGVTKGKTPRPGFYGEKANFTKFSIFRVFFIFLCCSKTTFVLFSGVFLLLYD